MKFTITIDDDDRAEAPESPWKATLVTDEPGIEVGSSGIGATPAAALEDLLEDIERYDDEVREAWRSYLAVL